MNKIIVGTGYNYGTEAIAMAMEVAHMARHNPEIEAVGRMREEARKPVSKRHADGSKIGRNEMCPYCKSGLKFKKCCGR